MPIELARGSAFPNSFNHFLPLIVAIGWSVPSLILAAVYSEVSAAGASGPVYGTFALGIFLPVLTFWLGLLFAPWAGWVPVLFVGVVLHLALLFNPWIVGPLAHMYTVPALILAAQRGYLSYWRSDWRRLMAAYAFFDDRMAQRYPWIAGLNPFYYVFSRHQHWRSHRVQHSYDQLRVFNRYSPKIRRMASIHLKVYWPLWLMNPVWLGILMSFMLVAGFFPISKDTIEPLEQFIFSIPIDHVYLPFTWFLFFPWIGWLPISLLLVHHVFISEYHDGVTPYAVLLIIVLLQKGYLRFNRDWPRMMLSTVFIDTRLHRYNKVITRLNPAIIGMEYLPPLAKKFGIPPQVTLFAWWTLLLFFPCSVFVWDVSLPFP